MDNRLVVSVFPLVTLNVASEKTDKQNQVLNVPYVFDRVIIYCLLVLFGHYDSSREEIRLTDAITRTKQVRF
mgnify:FL=1